MGFYGLPSLPQIGPLEAFILLLVVGALVAVYILFIRHNAPYAHSNAFGRHINFDHYHLDTIIKVLYFLVSVVNVLIGLGTIFSGVALGIDYGMPELFFGGLIGGILSFALLQFFARMFHEAIIMFVHMAEDVRGIRDSLGASRVGSRTPQPVQPQARAYAPVQPVSAPRPAAHQQTAQGYSPTPVVTQERWTCLSCGALVNSGQFCPKCGAKRG